MTQPGRLLRVTNVIVELFSVKDTASINATDVISGAVNVTDVDTTTHQSYRRRYGHCQMTAINATDGICRCYILDTTAVNVTDADTTTGNTTDVDTEVVNVTDVNTTDVNVTDVITDATSM